MVHNKYLTTLKIYITVYIGLVANRGIHVHIIVYIFAHLHRALLTEINMVDMNLLQAAKELVRLMHLSISSIGRGFHRSPWPRGRAFELFCCPWGGIFEYFVNI